jgi:hypothetical protein
MQSRTCPAPTVVLVMMLGLTLAACGPRDDASPVPSAPPASTAGSVPPTTSGAAGSAPTGQTETEWGPIWDALPAGFPRYPGATPADDATDEPASGIFALAQGDPAEIATWMQASLESATYSTEGLSGPFEDGGYVLDSVGDDDCRIQTMITPRGGLIIVTVRYGVACPA